MTKCDYRNKRFLKYKGSGVLGKEEEDLVIPKLQVIQLKDQL